MAVDRNDKGSYCALAEEGTSVRIKRRSKRQAPTNVMPKIRHLTLYLAVVTLISLTVAEVVARLASSTTYVGQYTFFNVALPPLRPDEIRVRQALQAFSQDPLLIRDPDLGWTVRPNRSENGDETNAQGIRAKRDHLYRPDPSENKIRIATLGDSYVYCLEVKNGETWQDYLEGIRSDVEFLNFGLPGAGVDQAFLRWRRDGRQFKTDIVILAIWPDDINRNLAIFDYYRGQMGVVLNKPRLVLSDLGPKFVNYPVMSNDELIATLANPETSPLVRHDFWYKHDETTVTPIRKIRLVQIVEGIWYRYQRKLAYQKIFSGEAPEGMDVTFSIAKMFAEEVSATGAVPIILMIPDRTRLDLKLGSRSVLLVERMKDAGINVIDMTPTFGSRVKMEGAAKYYVNGVGHNSPFGNQIFAAILEKELRPYIHKVQGAKRNREK